MAEVKTTKRINPQHLHSAVHALLPGASMEIRGEPEADGEKTIVVEGLSPSTLSALVDSYVYDPDAGRRDEVELARKVDKARAVLAGEDTFTAGEAQALLAHLVAVVGRRVSVP